MALDSRSEDTEKDTAQQYEAPTLTRFGTIEEWTLGALGGITVSLVI